MRKIPIRKMTDRQRRVWLLRYGKRLRLRQIARRVGMSVSAVSKMLQRAQLRAGLPKYRVSIIRTKPRRTLTVQFREVWEQYSPNDEKWWIPKWLDE